MIAIDVSEPPPAEAPLWLGADALRRLLPPAAAVEAVAAALAGAGAHAASGHAALAYDVDDGAFHVKTTALAAPRPVYVAKINANFPGNPARGLPTIQGVAALFDAADGRLLALLDSPELTALRTGAATAVAARYLARTEASRLLLCGAGRQAFAQAAALAAVRPLARVWVHDLDVARAARLAARLAAQLGCEARAVGDPAEVSRRAEIVVTCTTARAPFLGRDHLAPGTFVAAVGADHPSKQEIDPELVAASRLFVDSPEQALACGELHHAVAAGAMTPADVAGRLDELVTGAVEGRRSPDEITLFDSTGIALEDAAAALAAYERWRVASTRDAP
jgi:ornithine cyclodeaminase/alanine dehydrogenase-like protein (mu-crystallin family)